MIIRKFMYCCFFLVLASYNMRAQVIEQSFLPGARNASLGDADISSAYDVGSMYQNPAATVFMKESSVLFNHAVMRGGMGMVENLAFPILPKGGQMISAGFEIYHLGYLEHPDVLNGQHIIEYKYDVALATVITPTLSIGALAALSNGITSSSSVWAASYSIGMDYSPSADINYSIVFKGLGNDIQYLPEDSVIGANTAVLPNRLEIGATMSYPSSLSLRRQIVTLALANEKIFGKSGLLYKVGLEIHPLDFLSFRFGFITGPSVNDPRFGLGFLFDYFQLHYVYYSHNDSNMMHQFSISFLL